MRYLLKIKSLLTAITQQLTYLYKMILPHRRMNTQRYQNGCACGKQIVLQLRHFKKKEKKSFLCLYRDYWECYCCSHLILIC